ncbi:MAG TPA: hypothetical protein VHQ65_04255 [Thermoanaerobaculia bacterium]|nr:hypothetical protein [Thermoanaerobaculia bacterium]
MWYEKGRSAGSRLEERTQALDAIRLHSERQVQQQRTDLRRVVAPLEKAAARREHRCELLASLVDRLRAQKRQLDLERDRLPSEFSLIKGGLYLVLSLALILADISLLGQVSARFLNYSWFSGDVPFSKLIFSDPITALAEFPDLLWLVLSVLLLGFFLKVWRDVDDADPRTELQTPVRRGRRERWIFTFLLICALASVFLMSAARLTMSFEGEAAVTPEVVPQATGINFPGFVSFVLGFSLPLVSAGFFVRGYEALEKRYRLFRVSRRLQCNELLYSWLRGRNERLETEIERLHRESQRLSEPGDLEAQIAAHQEDFERGYDEARRELLTSTNLVERLRPVVLERALRREVV